MSQYLMPTYARLPVRFERGQGVWLWDNQGHKYFDALSGLAVCGLGHAHPAVTQAICEQSKKLLHTSNLFQIPNQEQLARRLAEISGMENMFFGNTGAEANEAAIKLARLYGNNKGIKLPTVVVMEHSFHGRTMATLTATGNPNIQAGFGPLVQGFERVPFNDIEAIKTLAAKNNNIVAILVEPIQGEGGINIPDNNYLTDLRKLCDEHKWLLMFDEIQCGLCRTGRWFAHQHHDIKPDVMCLAKSLGNGIPIGVCLAQNKAAHLFKPGNHGTTFGGNPFSCYVALHVLQALEKQNCAQVAELLGNRILSILKETLHSNASVKDIRGKGLMLGIELNRPCKELVTKALEHGLIINVTAEKVIRLLPPLIMTESDTDFLVEKLTTLINQFN